MGATDKHGVDLYAVATKLGQIKDRNRLQGTLHKVSPPPLTVKVGS